MIARPTPSSLHQVYSFPCHDETAYIPYTTEASLYDSTFHSDKRLKLQPQLNSYYTQPFDNASSINTSAYGNMQQSQLRTSLSSLTAPHINPQRSSQPASPATVATTTSQACTPSPSPSRVTILSSDNSNSDWSLYDDSLSLIPEQQFPKERRSPLHSQQHYNSQHQTHHRHHHNESSDPQFNSMMLDPPYANSNYYTGYTPNQSTAMGGFMELPQQPQRSTHNFLKPSYSKNYRALVQAQPFQQEMSDDCEEPPALSPSSHKGGHSSRLSVSEGDYHSPITPIDSPPSHDGAETSQVHTPVIGEGVLITIFGDYLDGCLRFESEVQHPIPKLNRTVSDAVEDELFHNDASMEDYQGSPKASINVNPQFARYFQAAQKQHSLAQRSITNQLPAGRETSPFRANSDFHPGRGQVSPVPPVRHSNLLPGYPTARSQREQQKEMENAALLSQQLQKELETDNITPKTISPKDAMLEYPEPEDEASRMSLFTEVPHTNGNGTAPSSYHGSDLGEDEEHDFSSIATSRRGSEASSMPSVEVYSFNTSSQLMPSFSTFPPYLHLPAQAQQAPSGNVTPPASSQVSSQQSIPSSPMSKPVDSKADTGAYTCTDPGCSLRFPTPQKMQKHRREAHRNTTPSVYGARHAGPHRCTRINPTTNKPCNTIFSRPYDLTRHEDTIHNTAREKVRCELCNDEKTFSRQDALTRHKKVKHGIEK